MRVWTFMLAVVLSMACLPAFAEWSLLDVSADGDKWFIDFDTLRKGKTPRAWVMKSAPQVDKFGNMSSIALQEADCAEWKTRVLALHGYTQKFGEGASSFSINTPGEWVYPIPGSIFDYVLKTLCAKGNN